MPKPGPPRVAIGQFANLISLGLWSILGHDSGFQVVATHQDYPGLITALGNKSAPDIVVLDESLAVSAVIAGLRNRSPGVGIIFITHGATAESRHLHARLAERAGISCISTDTNSTELRAAVRLAAEGQKLLASRGPHRPAGLAQYDSMTPRERQVLSYLLRGWRPAQIAVELTITSATVRTHIKRIYRKLGVRSREQLLRLELPIARLSPREP